MKILVRTIAEKAEYTISKLYIDGNYECDVIEDKVRNLSKEKKIAGKTAIPKGEYDITLDVVSPKYSQYSFYQQYANGGRLPRLLNVPYFDGILIHAGNTEKDSAGCLIVGKNTKVGMVTESRETFRKLYAKMIQAKYRRERITIEIVRKSY